MTHSSRESRRGLTALLAAAALALGAALALAGPPEWNRGDWCSETRNDHQPATVCEVRDLTLARVPAVLHVEPGENGSIEVAAHAANRVSVKARVEAWGGSKAEAQALLVRVRIVEDGDVLRAAGPATDHGTGWSVSFRIEAPAGTPLELSTGNGAVAVHGMNGRMLLTTANGPLAVVGSGGDISARTANGPLSVELTGTFWTGRGLVAHSTNGPVALSIPRSYDANLEYGTANGPLSGARPAASEGRGEGFAHVKLGKGGAALSVTTQNGPFSFARSR